MTSSHTSPNYPDRVPQYQGFEAIIDPSKIPKEACPLSTFSASTSISPAPRSGSVVFQHNVSAATRRTPFYLFYSVSLKLTRLVILYSLVASTCYIHVQEEIFRLRLARSSIKTNNRTTTSTCTNSMVESVFFSSQLIYTLPDFQKVCP